MTGGTPLYALPDFGSEAVGDMKAGEEFALLDVTGNWAWGYRPADHLVGYVEASKLTVPDSGLA